jgi:SprT protein
MPKKEVPISYLEQYLPPGTVDMVTERLHFYKVHLTVARERKSVLGDYRHRTQSASHRISVNGNLNSYAFLITLLHELAHLLTFEQYGNQVASHGKEWKAVFGKILEEFIHRKLFPPPIEKELVAPLQNPAASSCAEAGLLRVLRNYDVKKNGHLFVEDVEPGKTFRLKDGRVFKKGNQLRKRFQCIEVATGKVYLFSPVYEVEVV